MQGNIRIINEAYQNVISHQSLDILVPNNEYHTCWRQDGEIITLGGKNTCESTTLSSVITLKLETK